MSESISAKMSYELIHIAKEWAWVKFKKIFNEYFDNNIENIPVELLPKLLVMKQFLEDPIENETKISECFNRRVGKKADIQLSEDESNEMYNITKEFMNTLKGNIKYSPEFVAVFGEINELFEFIVKDYIQVSYLLNEKSILQNNGFKSK